MCESNLGWMFEVVFQERMCCSVTIGGRTLLGWRSASHSWKRSLTGGISPKEGSAIRGIRGTATHQEQGGLSSAAAPQTSFLETSMRGWEDTQRAPLMIFSPNDHHLHTIIQWEGIPKLPSHSGQMGPTQTPITREGNQHQTLKSKGARSQWAPTVYHSPRPPPFQILPQYLLQS